MISTSPVAMPSLLFTDKWKNISIVRRRSILSLSLDIFCVLKVIIYIQSMSLNLYFRWVFFVWSLSPSIINYACPHFQTTRAMALMFTFQLEFKLSMLPSMHVIFMAYVNCCFIIIWQNFCPVSFSSRIS